MYPWGSLVHKSEGFLGWMKKTHPNIILIFILGNCTSVFQPLDVGVQRVLKQSFKRSAHADIVAEISGKLAAGSSVTLDMSLPVLRDRALGWIVKAYHDINKPALVKKAFELCRVKEYNLSQESLTKPSTLQALSILKTSHLELRAKLTNDDTAPDSVTKKQTSRAKAKNSTSKAEVEEEDIDEEEEMAFTDDIGTYNDSCDVPVEDVIEHIITEGAEEIDGLVAGEDGSLMRLAEVEDPDAEVPDVCTLENPQPEELGRGKQLKKPSKLWEKDWVYNEDDTVDKNSYITRKVVAGQNSKAVSGQNSKNLKA
ncbi:hypothetical protein K435DRAFT_804908 [Dendrothele bispora CBS 962.96]|uniref:DDE-1 domain-containing protein n=1 Tax=Dendrothele bispora (strain CBS 962.96) TaxID=1314807 RepID=A0A4S8LE61_DENBC|nr:hypothetical protein K435DRAFT_804908 [Dendrothele bispora CBS 962.96]